MELINYLINHSWPWYISGPLIGLMVPLLLLVGNKQLGISSSLKHLCVALIPYRKGYFNYSIEKEYWNLLFVLGLLVGGMASNYWLHNTNPVEISQNTENVLSEWGIAKQQSIFPFEVFNWKSLLSIEGFFIMVVGGFLVGFGTRWANGCTSGHAIMGLSMLNTASLIAVVGFFIGGLLATHYLLPLLFK